jgi:hypothetical protein
MTTAPNRRKLPPLRRAVAYLPESSWDWLLSSAAMHGWTVSRMMAYLIDEAQEAERQLMVESEEELLAMAGER